MNARTIPATGQSEKAQKSKEKILQAANEVMFDVGRDRFTPTEVARRAGVAIGLVYRYFPSKEALIEAVLPPTRLDQLEAREAQLHKVSKLPLDDAGKWAEAKKIFAL